MNNDEARRWLDAAWERALNSQTTEPDEEIDRLVSSKVVSIRYALITQLLGKIADSDRGLLFLQSAGEREPGAWNARSFCDAVVVPWVTDNHNVIGTSREPYASKPLRRERLDEGAVRDKNEWDALVDFLRPLDQADPAELETVFSRCLESVARRLTTQSFSYEVPARVSMAQMRDALEAFLEERSGGLRLLAVTTALMRVLGRGFSLFKHVESQGLNEADSLSGAPGDVMCYDHDDELVLAVEVKDRALTLSDVKSSARKTRESSGRLVNLVFATSDIQSTEKAEIDDYIATAWASGLNISQIDIMDFAMLPLMLLGEEWRPALLREIGNELDSRGEYEHRRAWQTVLSGIHGDTER